MKVSNFMQKVVTTVSPNEPVRKVIKIIFNLGFTAVPVVEKKKLVGIVTEQDVLQKLFPSVSDFMQDIVASRNFDAMEANMSHLMNLPIKEIMTPDAITLTPDAPLMKAQSTMLLRGCSHIPIISADKTFLGLISQGDIFRTLVENDIPFDSNEEYHQWLSYHWDLVIPWEQRLSNEIPSLHALFKKNKTKTVVDIFCGTGEHVIALAKKGYDVTGLNSGSLMHRKAVEKYSQLNRALQDKVHFRCGNYSHLLGQLSSPVDSIVFMGNSLGHLVEEYHGILKTSYKRLEKSGTIVMQITNIDKILKERGRLQYFTIAPSKLSKNSEYAFIQFFDPPKPGEKHATLNMAILSRSRNRWQEKAVNGTPIAYFNQSSITNLLKKIGFAKIEIFGSKYYKGSLFDTKFNASEHDWMNVVAHK